MTASEKERRNIKQHLPHDLLKELYLNSRIPIKQLSRKLGISHHTVSRYMKEYEEKYKLHYTIDVDVRLLGFSDARIIGIKLDGTPEREKLIKRLKSYKFIQNAFLGVGDFDLILHVICPTPEQYSGLEYKMRIELSRYKPILKVVTLGGFVEGFLPIDKGLIDISKNISKNEKKLLSALLENSRIKLKDLAKRTSLSKMQVIYCIKKMQKDRIINRFSATIQKPDKDILLFFGVSTVPTEKHFDVFLKDLLIEVVNKESKNNIATDYSVVVGTSGSYDMIEFGCFKDGLLMSNRGPEFIERIWKAEYAKVDKSVLTDAILGEWPFNSNSYHRWAPMLEDIKEGKEYEMSTYDLL